MIKLSQAIVVEGKYDKNALRQLVDAPVFETNGFGVMKNRELVELLRLTARRRGPARTAPAHRRSTRRRRPAARSCVSAS